MIDFYRSHKKRFRVVYQPEREAFVQESTLMRDFENACLLVNSVRDITFVVDEIDRYVKATHMPGFFANLVDYGRHYGIDLIVNCRRAARIPRDLTAQADVLISFNQKEPRDLQYLDSVIGECSKELPNLPPYHFIKYEDGEATKHEPIKA